MHYHPSSPRYTSVVARGNYLTTDRVDIAFAIKECARKMQSPSKQDWARLERVALYLKHRPRLLQWFVFQPDPGRVTGYTDTDWAGCVTTRRSTTGGLVQYGKHTLRHWCRTQAVVALSSAEAELYGAVKATSEVLGILSMYRDIGKKCSGHVMGDASACLSIT